MSSGGSLGRTLTLRVARIEAATPEVRVIDLVHPRGLPLPGYTAGAHIDVHTPGGFVRTYSLAEAPPAEGVPRRYRIGVKREGASRGGSAALHEQLHEGDLLAIGSPRNSFPLHGEPAPALLLAGGIGLTPLLAMAGQLARDGRAFTLAVFARSRAHLAFGDALARLGDALRLHFDDAAAPEKLDLAALIGEAAARHGAQLYLCGPAGFMQAALAHARAVGWPEDAIHLEYFAPPESSAADAGDEPFVLHLARSDARVPVAADQTAVQALHEVGIDIPVSCEQGVCGTCVVPWRAVPGGGAPEHRDFCLSASERGHKLALCCSRARGGVLTLEL
jgi:vanillate O-demethylase ferredoxin subunit